MSKKYYMSDYLLNYKHKIFKLSSNKSLKVFGNNWKSWSKFLLEKEIKII